MNPSDFKNTLNATSFESIENTSRFQDIEVTERLILSSISSASLIDQQYGRFLLPPPKGIYKVGEVNPCMFLTKTYFHEDEKGSFFTDKTFFQFSGKTILPISDIRLVKSNVYDETGKIVIPAYMMLDKERYLSSEPSVPYRGILLVELLIRNFIDFVSSIPGRRRYPGRIESHLIPEFINNSVVDSLEVICQSLFLQIEQFIGNDRWHIYYIKRVQFDIIIEKTIDYRIHYYNVQHSQENTDADSS